MLESSKPNQMKKVLIFILSMALSTSIFAQAKPIYFYGSKITTDPAIATAYGIYGKVGPDSLCVLKTYNLMDELLSTGVYKDETLKVEHGDFVFYNDYRDFNYEYNTTFYLKDKTRFVSQKGRFEEGLQTGRWISFFPNGNIFTVTNYTAGKKNGLYAYYDIVGNVIQTGKYVMDKKDGEWFYNRGKKREVYVMGVLQRGGKATGTIN